MFLYCVRMEIMSSIKIQHTVRVTFFRTVSISLWKLAGELLSRYGKRLTLSLRLAFKLLNPPCRAILRALKKNLKVLHFLSQYYEIFSHYRRRFAVSRAHKMEYLHVFGARHQK
jgi:hypothetical protein